MEYIVSARKYRPLTFDTVVGQTTLTTTLKNAITSGRLAHAYLFCGPRGVGKTTCARIFARAINCLNPTSDGEACGVCESCRSFNEQRSYNIFELDAASNNSVEDIRLLMEQTRIPPQVGKYKVFIIDEVHMLSAAAFNAFLKTLEEPPAHVIFILATTEKHKLLPTIISRCQIYDFERITVQNITDHLRMVADKEGYTCEEEALSVIAEKADGAMRDALSIFDQVAAYCRGNITYDKTIEDLNVLNIENYFRIIDFSLDGKVVEILLLLDDAISKGFDPGNICQGLAGHIRNVMMAKDERTTKLLEVSANQKTRYAGQAAVCPPRFLYEALKLLNGCEIAYRQSTNKRLLVELTLIQIAQLSQRAEEAPAQEQNAGKLKPLFGDKAKLARSETAPPQTVTTTVHTAATPVAENKSVSAKPPEQSEKQPEISDEKKEDMGAVKAKHSVKLSNGSFTLVGTTQTKKEKNEDIAEKQSSDNGEILPEAEFTQEELGKEWLAMCKEMQLSPDTKGLALRMKNLVPTIKTFPQVELVMENDMLLEEVKNIIQSVQTSLRNSLNNHKLVFILRLAEPAEVKPKLSRTEMVEEMKKNNPALGLLFSNFDLELS